MVPTSATSGHYLQWSIHHLLPTYIALKVHKIGCQVIHYATSKSNPTPFRVALHNDAVNFHPCASAALEAIAGSKTPYARPQNHALEFCKVL